MMDILFQSRSSIQKTYVLKMELIKIGPIVLNLENIPGPKGWYAFVRYSDRSGYITFKEMRFNLGTSYDAKFEIFSG